MSMVEQSCSLVETVGPSQIYELNISRSGFGTPSLRYIFPIVSRPFPEPNVWISRFSMILNKISHRTMLELREELLDDVALHPNNFK